MTRSSCARALSIAAGRFLCGWRADEAVLLATPLAFGTVRVVIVPRTLLQSAVDFLDGAALIGSVAVGSA